MERTPSSTKGCRCRLCMLRRWMYFVAKADTAGKVEREVADEAGSGAGEEEEEGGGAREEGAAALAEAGAGAEVLVAAGWDWVAEAKGEGVAEEKAGLVEEGLQLSKAR